MNNFLWALKFLTILPIDRGDSIKIDKSGSVVCWFPIVGFCIGLFLAAVYFPVSFFFPPLVADVLVIIVYIVITGALHLDGFADTCDGIWGGWNKEKRLEIMRDSRIGGFGAVGLICLLGLKYACFHSMGEFSQINPASFGTGAKDTFCFISPVLINKCVALLVMPVMGRWAQVCAAGLSEYARKEPGTGSFILEMTTIKHVIYASVFPVYLLWYFYNLGGFVIGATIIIFTLIWIWYIKKKIGGMTGDTLGATNEAAELLFLLSLLFLS